MDGKQETIDVSADTGTYTLGGATGSNLTDLVNDIQTKLTADFGTNSTTSNPNVQVKLANSNELEFYTSDGQSHNITVNDASSNSVLNNLGFTDSQTESAVSSTDSLYDIKDQFTNSSYFTTNNITAGEGFQFSINGQAFSFTYNNSISDIVNKINSDSSAGVTAYYDSTSGKLMLTANKSGDINNGSPGITINDTSGVLKSLFNVTQNSSVGQDAKFSINGTAITQASNSFTQNNVTFNFTGTGASTVSVATDTSSIATQISNFVTQYNTALASMYTEINQTQPTQTNGSHYLPLTSSQEATMSATDITNWNNEAQEGLLYNDSILTETASNLRTTMSSAVYVPKTLTGNNLSTNTTITSTANQFTLNVAGETKQITLIPILTRPVV